MGDRGARIHRADLRARMRALALPPDDHALFGSVPLLVHGLVTDVGDIDVLARGAAWERAARLAPPVQGSHGDWVVRLDGQVEVFDSWMGVDVDAVIDRAEVVDGMRCADLRDVLAFKRRLARPKDVRHIALLEAHLRAGTDA